MTERYWCKQLGCSNGCDEDAFTKCLLDACNGANGFRKSQDSEDDLLRILLGTDISKKTEFDGFTEKLEMGLIDEVLAELNRAWGKDMRRRSRRKR